MAAQLAAPILAGQAIDELVLGATSIPAGVLTALFFYGAAAAVNAVAGWASQAMSVGICARVARDLRDEAAAKLKTLPLKYLDSHQSGDILSRITVDVETFSDGLLMAFTQFFSGILTILGTLGFMLATNLSIGLTVALVTPLSLFSATFISQRSYRYFRAQSDTRGALTGCVSECRGAGRRRRLRVRQAAGARLAELKPILQGERESHIFTSSLQTPSRVL